MQSIYLNRKNFIMKHFRYILLIISLFFLTSELSSYAFSNQFKNTILQTDLFRIQTKEIYVSLEGDDSLGDGTKEKSYKTIQKAIDNSNNGDVIIVLPGRYIGNGNINLDSKGKEIEIRSFNPIDPTYLNNTIIDAKGQGLIMRFLNDEKSKTIINGFSLVCGDTTIHIAKGIPGFFEFSLEANPIIRNIKILGETKASKDSYILKMQLKSSDNSINPFFHPIETTDYYGSGDANNDGVIDISDWNAINEVIDGLITPNIRCDIDGNGQITANDATLLLNSINSSLIIPSSWNYLNNTQKNDWVDKMLQNDKTNENPYELYFYQCGNYAKELYTHFNHFLSDLNDNEQYPLNVVYNGGQSIYNLPVYTVGIIAPGFGHSINAVLVGENPLDFNDWRFIEPQTDLSVTPGFWDMPFNSDITIDVYENPSAEVCDLTCILNFHVDEESITVTGYNTDLLLAAPSPTVISSNNSNYQWYPSIVVSDTAFVLYDQTRDDLSRITDIHIKNIENWKDKPITLFEENSFLLDYCQESDSIIHLLFTSKLTKRPGVYYGRYNIKKNVLSEVARISSSDSRVVISGKLIIAENEIYAFWLLNPFSTLIPSPGGIYWSHKSNSTDWESEALLYSIDYPIFSVKPYGPSIFPYLMDGVLLNNGTPIVVAQSLHDDGSVSSDIIFMHYNGSNWTIDSLNYPLSYNGALRDLDLIYDSNNILNLVFTNPGKWATNLPSLCYVNSIDNGNNWSEINTIESSSNYSTRVFCNPRLASDDGRLILTYLNREYPSEIFWRIFENSVWQPVNSFSLPENNYPWFPQIAILPSNRLLFVWSNSNEGKIELTNKIIGCNLSKPPQPIGSNSIPFNSPPTVYYTNSVVDADEYEWVLNPSTAGTLNANNTIVSITWNSNYSGQAILKVKASNGCGESEFSDGLIVTIADCLLPVGAGIISGETSVCQGQGSVIYSVPEITNATSYLWILPSGATGSSNTNSISVNYSSTATSGNITVKGTNSCGDGALTNLPVEVNNKPVIPVITQNESILHSDALIGNQWYDQNGLIINATDQNYTVQASGRYYVIVTLLNCTSDTSNIVYVNITGMEPIGESNMFNVYPNPSSNILIIEIVGNIKRVNFEILNSNGQVILKDRVIDKYVLQTSSLIPGIYIIKFEHGESFEFRKIIKE